MNTFKLNMPSNEIEHERIVERLNELLALTHGWGVSGDELPISKEAAQGFLNFIKTAGVQSFVRSFGLFPTDDGGLLLEGKLHGKTYHMLSIEIQYDGKICTDLWHETDGNAGNYETYNIDEAVKVLDDLLSFDKNLVESMSPILSKPASSYSFVQVKIDPELVKFSTKTQRGRATISHVVNFSKTEGYNSDLNNLSLFDTLCGERIVGHVQKFVESFVELESIVGVAKTEEVYNCQSCLKNGVFLVGTQTVS